MISGLIETLFKIVELIWNAPTWLVVLVIVLFSGLYFFARLSGYGDDYSSSGGTGYGGSSSRTYARLVKLILIKLNIHLHSMIVMVTVAVVAIAFMIVKDIFEVGETNFTMAKVIIEAGVIAITMRVVIFALGVSASTMRRVILYTQTDEKIDEMFNAYTGHQRTVRAHQLFFPLLCEHALEG